jgi:serine/threonine protein kinase
MKPDFTLKIADFGLSRKLMDCDKVYDLWENNTALPISYMAPEALAAGQFTVHSECWSFGVVVWELFTFAECSPYSTEFENYERNELFIHFLANHLASGQRLTIPSIVPKKM